MKPRLFLYFFLLSSGIAQAQLTITPAGGAIDPSTQINTGTGAITLTAGGTNQNITLTPSGTGYISSTKGIRTTSNFATGGNLEVYSNGHGVDNTNSRNLMFGGDALGMMLPQDYGVAWVNISFGSTSDVYQSTKILGFYEAVSGVAELTTGARNGAGATWRSKPLTTTQIVANTDNYSPATPAYYQRWSTDASRNITGLTFSTATQVDGQTHVIVNVGSFDIVLKHLTTSTAANQFQNSTGADITMTPGTEVNCWYDGTTAKWRVTKRGF